MWRCTVFGAARTLACQYKDQWIRCKLLVTGNKKYVNHGQTLIIKDNLQMLEEVAAANRSKVGASFQYAESLP